MSLHMTVHLVNPSHLSFGVGVITPRWLFVLAGATPKSCGVPVITDETLEPFAIEQLNSGDVIGIGIHTGNALRGYEVGAAHAVVKGDGDVVWPRVLDDAAKGTLQAVYDGGRVDAERFVPARWE